MGRMSEQEIRYGYYVLTAIMSVVFLGGIILAYFYIPTGLRRMVLPVVSMCLGAWLLFMGAFWFMHSKAQHNRAINEALDRMERGRVSP